MVAYFVINGQICLLFVMENIKSIVIGIQLFSGLKILK